MVEKRIDAPFLMKFNKETPYMTKDELVGSIIDEIGNILASRVTRAESKGKILPIDYGIPDLTIIDGSPESLEAFKKNCRKAILFFEPRVSDVSISECMYDYKKQALRLEIDITSSQINFIHQFSIHC